MFHPPPSEKLAAAGGSWTKVVEWISPYLEAQGAIFGTRWDGPGKRKYGETRVGTQCNKINEIRVAGVLVNLIYDLTDQHARNCQSCEGCVVHVCQHVGHTTPPRNHWVYLSKNYHTQVGHMAPSAWCLEPLIFHIRWSKLVESCTIWNFTQTNYNLNELYSLSSTGIQDCLIGFGSFLFHYW